MAITDTTFITRSLTARLFSTVTTIAIVALGVGLMLVLLGMRDAGEAAFRRGKGNMHMLISGPQQDPMVSVLNSVFYAGTPRTPLPWATCQSLAARYPLEWAIPTQLGDSYRGLPVMGTTPEFFTRFQPADGVAWTFAEGQCFAAPFELVVGAEAARVAGLKIGDKINLTHGTPKRGEPGHVHDEFGYHVVGILSPSATLHDRAIFSDLTSAWILHADERRERELGPDAGLTTADELIDSDRKITGVYARVMTREGSGTPAALQQVFDLLRSDPEITVAAPDQEIGKLFKIVSNVDRIIVALAATVLVVGAITIMLVLYQAMEQRRRQIAVLRVLGCSRMRVFGLVVTESAVIGTAGAVAGVLVSLVGSRVVAGELYRRMNLVIDPGLDPRIVLGVVLGTIVLASVAGLVPAISAYRTGVIRNLRPIA
ncbi:MAG: FtsX-like permease family protein [Phycisphaeraceae bacterium]|nr:MAG: FtsX-like permease family protein [Phycisphaeraceae bacterium]